MHAIDHRQLEQTALMHLQAGHVAQAVDTLLRPLRAQPGDLALRKSLGDLYIHLGQPAAGIECYRVVAGAHAAAGNLLAAMATCRAILAADPGHTETQGILAGLYARHSSGAAPFQVPAPVVTGVEIPAVPSDTGASIRVAPADLPRIPLFSDLSRSAFVWLLERLEMRRFSPGDVITQEGDFGDALFIIVNGTVRVEKSRADAPPLVLNRLGASDFLGEIALLGSGVRSATAIAETDAEVFELPRRTLDELMGAHPSVRQVMRRFYRERLFSDLVKTSPLFRPLAPEQVRDLVGRFREVEVERGTRLQVEGKRAEGLHVILEGRCEVSRQVNGRRVVLTQLNAGDAFGGTSFLTGEPAVTTVTARVRTTTLCMPSRAAPELLSQHPHIGDILTMLSDGGEKVMDAAVGKSTAGATSGASPHLQGDLVQIRPASMLVFLEMERMTGVLQLTRGPVTASLFIHAGRILDVEDGGVVEDPVARLLEVIAWDEGTFTFSFAAVEREDRVRSNTTGLLLEAARRADEAAR